MHTDEKRQMCTDAHMDEDQAEAYALIKRMMEKTGLDATNLARRAGLSPSTITRFMKGEAKHAPTSRTLGKLSRVSGVPSALVPSAAAPRRGASSKRSPYDGAIPDIKRAGKFGDQSVDIRFAAIWSKLDMRSKATLLTLALEFKRTRKAGAA